jgi:hypothetical protein
MALALFALAVCVQFSTVCDGPTPPLPPGLATRLEDPIIVTFPPPHDHLLVGSCNTLSVT